MTISALARRALSLVILLALLLTGPAVWAGQTNPTSIDSHSSALSAHRLVARFNTADQEAVLNDLIQRGMTSSRPLAGLSNSAVLAFDSAAGAEAALDWLDTHPDIAWAEPDSLLGYAFSPGDPLSEDQLWIQSVDLPAAWTITTGNADIIVAVVDSGVSRTHPDLEGKVLPGYDFLNDHAEPVDEVGHGTAVAGIIAARGGDGVGIAGVAMNTTILPVKVGSLDGSPISAIVAGIIWAVDEGAHVI
ncbi:MAG TPA: S8 family serine peptidase, partial [Thermomicrobiales bacterium]|nr:S8 family serine peptidase [Thermomicrobiales bacterium]